MTKDGASRLSAWFAGRIPDDWFVAPVEVAFDREEILVTGQLPEPAVADDDPEEAAENRAVAARARIETFREETRDRRIRIAGEAEARFARKVSWAARCGDTTAALMILPHLPDSAAWNSASSGGVEETGSVVVRGAIRPPSLRCRHRCPGTRPGPTGRPRGRTRTPCSRRTRPWGRTG